MATNKERELYNNSARRAADYAPTVARWFRDGSSRAYGRRSRRLYADNRDAFRMAFGKPTFHIKTSYSSAVWKHNLDGNVVLYISASRKGTTYEAVTPLGYIDDDSAQIIVKYLEEKVYPFAGVRYRWIDELVEHTVKKLQNDPLALESFVRHGSNGCENMTLDELDLALREIRMENPDVKA